MLADTLDSPGRNLDILTLSEFKYTVSLHHLTITNCKAIFMFANQKLFARKRQLWGRFQNDKQCNLLAVDSVDYKVESRKLRLF